MHPGKIVSTSQEVEVMVLDVDAQKRRISLGLKQTMSNPWGGFLDSFPVGTEVEGEIKNITEFGLFVGLPGEIDGMVHLSDIDWNKPGEEAMQDYRKGQMIKVKVLDVDVEKERISLGIKQLQADQQQHAEQHAGAHDRHGDLLARRLAGARLRQSLRDQRKFNRARLLLAPRRVQQILHLFLFGFLRLNFALQ